ncbi:MAG: aminoacyl-tRNA deacylase [Deltaproteobacteria bacterium]|nr:aminoacyl-tRNA deacylase [Deltaproteobacteria bacterium]
MSDHPITPAIRVLRAENVAFTPHTFDYVEKGGTAHSSKELGVDEHAIVKTLVFEDEHRAPIVVLMHGDREVSTKTLARIIGVKMLKPCAPDVAERHSGYKVGGTSPFGLKRTLPIYMQQTITTLERMYINGGGRGFLVSLAPSEAVRVLQPTLVEAAQ